METQPCTPALLLHRGIQPENNAAEFLLVFTKLRPTRTRREIFGRTTQPGIERGDEVFLPDLSVELPDAEPDQNHEAGQRHERCIEDAAFTLAARLASASPRRSRPPSPALCL